MKIYCLLTLAVLCFLGCQNNSNSEFGKNSDFNCSTIGYLNLGAHSITESDFNKNQKLIAYLLQQVREGNLEAYYPLTSAEMRGEDVDVNEIGKGVELDSLMSDEDLKAIFYSIDTVYDMNESTGSFDLSVTEKKLNEDDVSRLKIHQTWYYDEVSSSLISKVHSIKIMKNFYDNDGRLLANAVLFKINTN